MQDFFTEFKKQFCLDLKTSEQTFNTSITEPEIHRPGLALAGFTEVFSYQSIQMLGTTEWSFLESMGAEKRQKIFAVLQKYSSPLWVLCHGLQPHRELLQMCESLNIPLMVSNLGTADFVKEVSYELQQWFSPFTVVHASLVDVFGVGMLYIGDSNVGKSECVLDLVERGHRLVADDSVKLVRGGKNIIGHSDPILGHHMEIRGVGIIDIRSMFGIHAVRNSKKVEIIIELQYYEENVHYDRTGLDVKYQDVMGVQIPKVVIPVLPGKNITVISEVVAMDTLMKQAGVDSAEVFNQNLLKAIQNKKSQNNSQDNIFWYRQISGFNE
ncbi:MAG: HPr(Ser) kinase/phosphatase [Fibrobacter sp.]|nr:HPr(Ser) kinase/phosphatase [Fibrobacter sp.]